MHDCERLHALAKKYYNAKVHTDKRAIAVIRGDIFLRGEYECNHRERFAQAHIIAVQSTPIELWRRLLRAVRSN